MTNLATLACQMSKGSALFHADMCCRHPVPGVLSLPEIKGVVDKYYSDMRAAL